MKLLTYHAQLRENITSRFNMSELETLCNDIDIDFENIKGETLDAKVRELIKYTQRHSKFDILICQLEITRPHINWNYEKSDIPKTIELNKYPKPINTKDNIIEQDQNYQNNPKVMLTYYKNKNFSKCIELCNQYLLTNTNHLPSILMRGNACFHLQQYKQTIQDFTQAIRLDPNKPNLYINRGNAYAVIEQMELAIQDFTQAIKLDPFNAIPYSWKGAAHNFIKQHRKAIEDLSQAIEIDPTVTTAYTFRAITFVELNQIQDALKDLKMHLKLEPHNFFSQQIEKEIEKITTVEYINNDESPIQQNEIYSKIQKNIITKNTWKLDFWIWKVLSTLDN